MILLTNLFDEYFDRKNLTEQKKAVMIFDGTKKAVIKTTLSRTYFVPYSFVMIFLKISLN